MARSGSKASHGGDVLLERGAVLDLDALGLEPLAVAVGPTRLRAGRADVADIGATLDQEPGDQELGALVARERDPTLDRHAGERTLNRREEAILGVCHLGRGDAVGVTDGVEPGGGAVVADRRRAHDLAAGLLEDANRGRVEGMDGGNDARCRALHRARATRGSARPARRRGPRAPASCRCRPDRPGTSHPAASPWASPNDRPWAPGPGRSRPPCGRSRASHRRGCPWLPHGSARRSPARRWR